MYLYACIQLCVHSLDSDAAGMPSSSHTEDKVSLLLFTRTRNSLKMPTFGTIEENKQQQYAERFKMITLSEVYLFSHPLGCNDSPRSLETSTSSTKRRGPEEGRKMCHTCSVHSKAGGVGARLRPVRYGAASSRPYVEAPLMRHVHMLSLIHI